MLKPRYFRWLEALALAAYNAGEQRVLAAIEKTGQRDFWKLRAGGFLPRETSDYVPLVLAAIRVGSGQAAAWESTGQQGLP